MSITIRLVTGGTAHEFKTVAEIVAKGDVIECGIVNFEGELYTYLHSVKVGTPIFVHATDIYDANQDTVINRG